MPPFIDRSASVAQIALDQPACVHVFRTHRIDFCCRGGVTVEEACANKRLNAESIFAELESAVRERKACAKDPRELSTPRLIAHIVGSHHVYLRKALPFVEQLGRKVARVHGEHNLKLPELAELVHELREVFEPHLDDEESSVFPALTSPTPDPERIARELRSMHDDHLRIGEMLARMRTLADEYAVPDWACGSYRALMNELESIELDTLVHVHVENHVLMPRFVAVGRPGVAVRSRDARHGSPVRRRDARSE